jgi:hypothetical protein
MTTISILGIDIAKNTFQLHGADHTGKAGMRKRLPRHQLAAYVANLAPCTALALFARGHLIDACRYGRSFRGEIN